MKAESIDLLLLKNYMIFHIYLTSFNVTLVFWKGFFKFPLFKVNYIKFENFLREEGKTYIFCHVTCKLVNQFKKKKPFYYWLHFKTIT